MDDTQTAQPTPRTTTSLTAVPIEITVAVGRARPMVRDLLQLGEGSVLTLDKRLEDPVELFVGEKLIAIGVLEVADGDGQGQLTVRVTEVIDQTGPV
jgi:flagellar motor switch protein FliN/FliY